MMDDFVLTMNSSTATLATVGGKGANLSHLVRAGYLVKARQTHHYLSEAGLAMLDARSYFADQFYRLSASYDPATGFQAHRSLWRFVGVVRDLAAVFVGERRALKMIFSLYLRKFQQLRSSRETIQTYEALPRQPLVIGQVPWTGWVPGEDDVWVLEARGHTPDEVLFSLPEHQVLHTADLTFPLFPTFLIRTVR